MYVRLFGTSCLLLLSKALCTKVYDVCATLTSLVIWKDDKIFTLILRCLFAFFRWFESCVFLENESGIIVSGTEISWWNTYYIQSCMLDYVCCNQNRTFLKALWNRHKTHDLFSSAMLTGYIWRFKQRYVISVNYAMSRVKYTNYSLISASQVKGLTSLTSATSTISTTFGLLSTRICLENKNKILVVPSHWLKELAGSLNSKILFCDWLKSSRSNQLFVFVVTFHFEIAWRSWGREDCFSSSSRAMGISANPVGVLWVKANRGIVLQTSCNDGGSQPQ